MTNWTRKFKLGIAAVVAVAATGALGACFSDSTSPSEPKAAPAQARFSTMSDGQAMQAALAQGLLWEQPRTSSKSVTKIIGSQGGNIDIGETGVHLIVPPGAVAASTRFTITALPGSVVAYDFQPHGTVFAVPLTFSQDLGPTNFGHVKLPPGFISVIQGGYFSSQWSIDQSSGVAVVQELIPARSDWTWTGGAISFPIRHFSGYLISTGRSSSF